MENYYNIDSFEQFLKDSLVDFKMQPKKYVWKSIYNNVHPSKKMPSAFTSVVILISLFLLGIQNSDNQHIASTGINPSITTSTTKSHNKEITIASNTNFIPKSLHKNVTENEKSVVSGLLSMNKIKSPRQKTENEFKSTPLNSKPILVEPLVNTINLQSSSIAERKNILDTKTIKIPKNSSSSLFSYELYATPSIGYRNIEKNESSYTVSTPNQDDKSHHYSYSNNLNFEAGGAVLLNITKAFRVRAGMQLNYSKYKMMDNASDIASTAKNIGFGSSDMDNKMTNGNDNSLNFSSYQISFPIGTEFEIAGNNWLHWFAGAGIEPTYRLGEYASSTNGYNTFTPSDKRKWNVNTNVETFLSLKLSNGAYLNAGPQLKYQLLSNYDKMFNNSEKLYNIGLKLGISRNF